MFINLSCLFVVLFAGFFGTAQQITQKLILSDSPDSLLVNADGGHRFARNGDYIFETKKADREYYLYTPRGKIGPFYSTSARFHGTGAVDYYYTAKGTAASFYYKSYKGTTVYGPLTGDVQRQMTENASGRVAFTVYRNDSVLYYLDNRLLATRPKRKNDLTETDDWCSFSPNGQAIYYLPKKNGYVLYHNGQAIDSSAARFDALAINNRGQFLYSRGEKPPPASPYTFQFFAHTADTAFGPVRTVWKHFLNEDNSYYFSGDDNGPGYLLVNDTLYRNVKASLILTPGPKHHAFLSGEAGITVNGKSYRHPYQKTFFPAIDTNGNFSFFGLRDYYLYKYINGREHPVPLSRYGVRAVPLYISPIGSSVHYFKTDDSIYLYRDDTLLLPPVAASEKIETVSWKEMMLAYPPLEKPVGGHSLLFFSIGSTGYFLFNGELSKPMHQVSHQRISGGPAVGEIMAGNFTDDGFYVIQKTGEKEYTLNINNRYYVPLSGIDKLEADDIFFEGKEMMLYLQKGLSYYQYTITL